MPEVGLRELKTRTSEILREVRERRARYVITYRGRPIGVLMPIAPAEEEETETKVAWDELVTLGEEIGKGWQSPLTSAELLSSMRR